MHQYLRLSFFISSNFLFNVASSVAESDMRAQLHLLIFYKNQVCVCVCVEGGGGGGGRCASQPPKIEIQIQI